MNTTSRTTRLLVLLLVLVLPTAPARAGDGLLAGQADGAAGATSGELPSDAVLTPAQDALLEIAFEAASRMPVVPHLKDRSRAQERVVGTCFALDLPARAMRWGDRIGNWRRGVAHADFAFWCASHAVATDLEGHLERAREIATGDDPELSLDWRRDRIRAHIARAWLWLGRDAQAAELEAGLADSEVGLLWTARARRVEADAVDAYLDELEDSLSTGSLDRVRNALDCCVELYARFADDAAVRARIETAFDDSSSKLPRALAVDVAMRLARTALGHDDRASALRFVDAGKAIVHGASWTAEDHIPLMARLGALRFAAGERTQGRIEVDAARVVYENEGSSIVDIFRAGALRPLAEAYHAIGDDEAAREVYALAVDESVHNPNSRPRAEDLVDTCLSMANTAFEPGDALLTRMREVLHGLADPW